jgi:hypothetical protein
MQDDRVDFQPTVGGRCRIDSTSLANFSAWAVEADAAGHGPNPTFSETASRGGPLI